MRKIFFFDIDGTIVDNSRGLHTVSPNTRYAFQELSKEHIVMLATGRCKCLLPRELQELPLSGYLLGNGSYALLNGQELFVHSIPPASLSATKDYCIKNNLIYYFEATEKIYTNGIQTEMHRKFNENWGMDYDVYVDCSRQNGDPITNIMIVCPDYNACAQFEQELSPLLDCRLHHGYPSFDVGKYGVHKGSGVSDLLEFLGIDKKDAFAFGDGLNDLEMFEAVGNAVAMGNAVAKLKEKANFVTSDVIEEGVYEFLVAQKLIPPWE